MKTLLKITCATLFILSIISDSLLAAEVDSGISNLIGIPYLLKFKPLTPEEAKSKLRSIIMKRLTELQNWPGDYDKLEQNKVIAISYDPPFENPFVPYLYRYEYMQPHIGYWGGGWKYDTLDEARTHALKTCKGKCIVFLENDSLALPASVIDEYIRATPEYIKKEMKRLSNAEKIILVDRIVSIGLAESGVDTPQISEFPISHPINIGYPDWQQDFASACQDRVFYALMPIKQSEQTGLLMKLDKRAILGLYGQYNRTVNTVLDFTSAHNDLLMEKMAHFLRSYRFESDPRSSKEILFPKNLDDALKNETIKAIWVEGVTRVTKTGLPLVIGDVFAPVAILTKGAYGVRLKD